MCDVKQGITEVTYLPTVPSGSPLTSQRTKSAVESTKFPALGETCLSQSAKNGLTALAKRHCDTFLKIWVGICSTGSVVALRHIILTLRNNGSSPLPSPQANLSAKTRYDVIEKTEKNIAQLGLLRRCHVLKLWEDHGYRASDTTNLDCMSATWWRHCHKTRKSFEYQGIVGKHDRC